jgi:hypothetical protein
MMPFQQGFKSPLKAFVGPSKGGRPGGVGKPMYLPVDTGAGFEPTFDVEPDVLKRFQSDAVKRQQLPAALSPMKYQRPASSIESRRRKSISSGGYTPPGQRKLS